VDSSVLQEKNVTGNSRLNTKNIVRILKQKEGKTPQREDKRCSLRDWLTPASFLPGEKSYQREGAAYL